MDLDWATSTRPVCGPFQLDSKRRNGEVLNDEDLVTNEDRDNTTTNLEASIDGEQCMGRDTTILQQIDIPENASV